MFKWLLPKSKADALHYVAAFLVIFYLWTPIVTPWAGQLFPELIAAFLLFYITNKLAHKVFKVD